MHPEEERHQKFVPQIDQLANTACEAAGMWWASALRRAKIDYGAHEPKFEDIARDIQDKRLEIESVPAGGLERLSGILAQAVDSELDKLPEDDRYGIMLRVDFDPNEILLRAATEANLPLTVMTWPPKSSMRCTPRLVSVKYGHSASPKTIWEKT